MKKQIILFLFLFVSLLGFSQDTWVNGYTRKDGSYVQGYYRTQQNSTRNDNYSTVGNTNPYTGKAGTKPRDSYYNSSSSNYSNSSYNNSGSRTYNNSQNTYSYPSSYSSSRTIYTGPRGGKYYINSNGNKTYIK